MGPFFKDNSGVTETDILLDQEPFQVLVDTYTDPFGPGDNTKDRRFAIPNMYRICEHVENGEVVLNNDDRALRGQVTDELGGSNPLINV